MKLNHSAIATRVPHAGVMCLLDTVQHWDEAHILCSAAAPTDSHPLMRDGAVPSIAAVEYAAQASAVHGALLSEAQSKPLQRSSGLLAKLMQVELFADALPSGQALAIRAEMLSRDHAACLYSFEVRAQDSLIARGRFMVALSSAPVIASVPS